MILLYSGAADANSIQSDPKQSLGGLISSTVVPNKSLSNLFSIIASKDLRDKNKELIALFLKNDSGVEITDVYIHQVIESEFFDIEFAAVLPQNNEEIEKISDRRAEPYIGTFFSAVEAANRILLINSLPAGACIGLWIKREIKQSYLQKDCDTLFQEFENQTVTEYPIREDIPLVIEWT